MASLTKNMKYFDYYSRAYGAVLQGMLGEYQIRIPDEKTGKETWKKVYGLKAFSPSLTAFTTRILMTSGPAEAMATAAVIWGTIL